MTIEHALQDFQTWDGIVHHILEEFDKQPTPAILLFELAVLVWTVAAFRLLGRRTPRFGAHYAVLATGVVIFELFTAPMWNNFKLGVWAYVYKDVSWVLTLAWTTLILSTITLVDRIGREWGEARRFATYLVLLTVLAAALERVVVALGVRSYAPEVQDVLRDSYILGLGVSWHQLYYVPCFLALVIAFYKYFIPEIESVEPTGQLGPARWAIRFLLALAAVFFFEVMVEPMVQSDRFPAWSYVYRDISLALTLLWVTIIWVASLVVDLVGRRWTRGQRFAGYLAVAGLIALPIEAWFMSNGYRVYGPSAVANFTGLMTVFGTPIEVAMGTPLYLALVIAFIRYWSRIAESRGPSAQPVSTDLGPAAAAA